MLHVSKTILDVSKHSPRAARGDVMMPCNHTSE